MSTILLVVAIGSFLVGLFYLGRYFLDLLHRLEEVPTISNQRFNSKELAIKLSPREVKFVEFVLKRSSEYDYWYVDEHGRAFEYKYQRLPSSRELTTVFQLREPSNS